MSGGVDSSVAALFLKNQGYNVVGVFMKCWTWSSPRINADFDADERGSGCGWEQDAADARRVAEVLSIPFYVWDFEKEYEKAVVKYMLAGYKQGLTPNPDVMCNREIKFGIFLKRALSLGADFVATGHYVRLRSSTNSELNTNERIKRKFVNSKQIRYSLMAAKDKNKDQSYFLWTLAQDELRHSLFPIGEYLKPEVRQIARKAGLPTAEKKDSQGICFLGKFNVADFLRMHLGERKGAVVTTEGKIIGEHRGVHLYTIGQRHGLDLKTKNSVLGIRGKIETQPHYVASKDIKMNTLIVAEGENNSALYNQEVKLSDVNLISPIPYSNVLKNMRIRVLARVRYRQPLAPAVLATSGKRQGGRKDVSMSHVTYPVSLIFDKPQRFVAPGQSAVFYNRRGVLLGGGIIA